MHILILLAAGACGGFVAGLVGVGGGIIFAPVLFYFFQATGVAPTAVAPLTLGTSLFCTTVASSVSAWRHHRKHAVEWSVALRVGLLSAVVLFLVVRFVTTQSWFSARTFELIFGIVLLAVAANMSISNRSGSPETSGSVGSDNSPRSLPAMAGIGSVAGAVAALAGVGGGVILVPSYRQWLGFQMPKAVGTSSGTIVLISALGVLNYALMSEEPVAGTVGIGFVDVLDGLILAIPTLGTAQLGAAVAHRMDRRRLQLLFSLFAAIVAIRMLVG